MPQDDSVGFVCSSSSDTCRGGMLCLRYHARDTGLDDLPGMLALPKAAPRWSFVALSSSQKVSSSLSLSWVASTSQNAILTGTELRRLRSVCLAERP